MPDVLAGGRNGASDGHADGHWDYSQQLQELLVQRPELAGAPERSWFAFGRVLGLSAGHIKRARQAVREYYHALADVARAVAGGYRSHHERQATAATERNETARASLVRDLDESTVGSVVSTSRRRIAMLKEERDALMREGRGDARARTLILQREARERWVAGVRAIDSLADAELTAFTGRSTQVLDARRALERAYLDRLASIQQRLLAVSGDEHRALLADLDELITAHGRLRTAHALVDESRASDDAGQHALFDRLTRERQEVTNRYRADAGELREMAREATSDRAPRRRYYFVLLALAIVIAGTAEFTMVNAFTGRVLAIGTLYDAIAKIGIDGNTWQSNFAAVIKALFIFLFGLLPYSLSWMIKALLDGERNGVAYRWTLNATLAGGIAYLAATVVSAFTHPSDEGPSFALPMFFLTATLVPLGGWLLHLLFEELALWRRVHHECPVRIAAIDREIAELEGGIQAKRTALEALDAAAAAARERHERSAATLAAVQTLTAEDRNGEGMGERSAAAAIATLDVGYTHGVTLRAAGRDFGAEPNAPASFDALSEAWRCKQLLESFVPDEGEREEADGRRDDPRKE